VNGVVLDDKTLKFTLTPIFDQEKDPIGTNIFIEDVSINFQAKEYLTQANKAASVAELAAGVAHEIKNPLAIIQNYIELLKISTDPKERSDNLRHVESELTRIDEIIANLLSFSRMKRTTFNPVSLKMLLEEVLMLLSYKLSQKGIRLIRDLDNDPLVYGDENKLKQLFVNLIDNSIDAVLDEGSIRVAIIKGGNTDHSATVIVSDNGHGIPADIREKIFAPFFTTKMNRTNIGLGLAICQNIAELHSGVIIL
jgi:signal transduction histidine kinase